MSKLSFRARALDATKPLPIYNAVDLPDLSEYNTINRTVPQMPTGMEKEEETERHLQDVIHAQQMNRNVKHVVIPTPENAINVPYYDSVTASIGKTPAQYIRLPGLSLDEDVPDYDLDSEDEEWLSLQTKENECPLSNIHFERMMDKLEKGSGNTVLSDRDAQALLRDDEDLVLAVYEYWLGKRLRLGRALIPTVKQERRDGTASGSNPYLAFRKRTEKMQTRKNRKNDETAYMQMQKLKRDLDKAFTLANMVKEREAKKHELAAVQMDIFKKRFMLEDWSGNIMSMLSPVTTQSATSRQNANVSNSAWDGSSVHIKMEGGDDYDVHQVGRHDVLVSTGIKKKSRKRKYYFPSNSTESPLPPMPATPVKASHDFLRNLASDKFQGEEELDGRFTFRRKPHVKYCPSRECATEWPWENDLEGGEGPWSDEEEGGCTTRTMLSKPKKFRFSRLTLSGQYIGLCRRRLGRGGRVFLDRIYSGLEEADVSLDEDMNQKMEVEPSLDSSMSLPISSAASSNHTPTGSTHSQTPPLARQQSEVIGSSVCAAEKLDGGLLVRSQSMEVGVVVTPKDTPTANAVSAVGGSQGEEATRSVPLAKKSIHFVDLPLSPSVELQNLPFIKPPPPDLDSAEQAQFLPHYAGGGGYNGDRFLLSRLPSFSEYREEMTTFSSLPTSHFTLHPSSSDAELEQSPTQFWNQTTFSYKSNSGSWNWNQTSNERASWQRKSSQISGINSTSSYPHPSNLIGNKYSNSVRRLSTQQQVTSTDREAVVEPNKKEMSRSSLSVTDSKTIVLTNSPNPWHVVDKKKELGKLLSQQQNHKLVNSVATQHKASGSLRAEVGHEGSSEKTKTPLRKEGGVVGAKANGSADAKSVMGASNPASKSEGKTKCVGVASETGDAGRETKGTLSAQVDGSRTPASVSVAVAPVGNSISSSNPAATSDASPLGANVSPLGANNADKTLDVSAKEESKREPSPKIVDVWSMKGPSNGILALNARRGIKRDNRGKPKKSKGVVGINLEYVKVVTSQFVAKTLKKKDEGVAVGDVVQPLGGILVRGSAGSRSGSSTPTILGAAVDMTTQQILPGIGVGRLSADLHNPSGVSSVVSQPLQENIVVAKGVEVKRTNSIGSDSSVGVHVTLSSQSSGGLTAHHPTGTTGTNGTNFPEIFNSKRKLSENSERGLKQALVGTVMNHNTLLENTTKPLLPQTIKSSSEVT